MRPARPIARSPGKVKVIGKVADPQTGNLPVRILVENADGKLTLGQAVSATIVVHEEKVLAVPVEAVHDRGEGTRYQRRSRRQDRPSCTIRSSA